METTAVLKFSEFKYERPDIEAFQKEIKSLLNEIDGSDTLERQIAAIRKAVDLRKEFDSMQRIASIRYTINTKDEYYANEHDFFDISGPVIKGMIIDFYKTLVKSKFSSELKEYFGSRFFELMEISLKTYSKDILDDLKMENQLVTKYVKLISSAEIFFEGRDRNLAGMDVFMQSPDREIRKRAFEARWKFFENNEEEIDEIYDNMVKVRTSIARKLGYKNFVQLGYDRLRRSGYTTDDIAGFRSNVEKYIVPASMELNSSRKKRLGYENLYYYDSGFFFRDGNPSPKGPPEWILEKAKKMYEELSPETAEFINFLIDYEVLDLYNRDFKSPGGYCSCIYKYKTPFIFANLNGTDHDVKVFTHEAGHAFQFYESRNFELQEYMHATLEAAEIHSMSMEFITWPWMNLFFEEDTDKFYYSHLARSISFIPYGVTVDEFQHFVYENPEATPAERKKKWRDIEKKYSPDLDYTGNDFLERGGAWMHKPHIFRIPFYYIDYCLAEVSALQFWRKTNLDRESSWKDYLKLCSEGGSKSFIELLNTAKLESPFDGKTIKSIVDYALEWLRKNKYSS